MRYLVRCYLLIAFVKGILQVIGVLALVHIQRKAVITRILSMKPSIEIAAKMSVSLDYLVGKTDVQIDKNILQRILELSKFSDQDKEHIFAVLDAFVAKRKIQSIL